MAATSQPTQRGVFTGRALSNRPICDDHYRLTIGLEAFCATRPGQFVQLQCRRQGEQIGWREAAWSADRPPQLTQAELTDREPLLRRPFSLADDRRRGRRAEIDIIYRVIGTGTHWLAGAAAGEAMSVIGPLGNGFALRPRRPRAALVGGGVGIPPMLYLARALADAGKATVAFSGARSRRLLPLSLSGEPPADATPADCVAEFTARGAASVVATDDGSAGAAGPVSAAFARWLDRSALPADALAVYACGPEAMLRAVADLCTARGIDAQLALERHMACGMGTCQSCVVKRRADNDRGWEYALCCTDGPVFDAREIVWS
jgi:dihydroorotate dehydrogenase electron transfer subunit